MTIINGVDYSKPSSFESRGGVSSPKNVVYDSSNQGYSIAKSKQTSSEKLTGTKSTSVYPWSGRTSKSRKKKRSSSSSSSSSSNNTQATIESQAKVPKPRSSPQETAKTETAAETSLARSSVSVMPTSRDEIRASPYGEWDTVTRDQAIKDSSRRGGNRNVTVSEADNHNIISTRIVSGQETQSAQSDKIMADEQAMGQEMIDRPVKDSLKVSEALIGPLENVPKDQTAARGVTAAVEWAITLPAETLRSPVSVTEMGSDIKSQGLVSVVGQEVSAIMKDPAGVGVKAGLTAGLIVVPAAKVVRGRAPRGSGKRTTNTNYQVELTPQDIKSVRTDYITDFTYTREKTGVRGTGKVAVKSKGTEAVLDVRSFTEPQGTSFKTSVEARKIGSSKMDLVTGERVRATVISEESGKVTKSKTVVKDTKLDGQTNLLGESMPEQRLSMRAGSSIETGPASEVSIGKRTTQRSILNMEATELVDVSGTALTYEAKTGKGIRRRTYTREATVEKSAFEKTFRDNQFNEVGKTQDTLRTLGVDPPSSSSRPGTSLATRDIAISERAIRTTALAFDKVPGQNTQRPSSKLSSGRASNQASRGASLPGLGFSPVTNKKPTKMDTDSFETVRYPPSKGSPGPAETTLNVSGINQNAVGLNLPLLRQTTRGGRRTRQQPGQQFTDDIISIRAVAQMNGQKQRQKQATALATGQRQRQRSRYMLPANSFVEPTRPTGPGFLVSSGPKGPVGGAIIPPFIAGGKGQASNSGSSGRQPRRFGYVPTLAGLVSGDVLSTTPRGAKSGLSIRPKVKRR